MFAPEMTETIGLTQCHTRRAELLEGDKFCRRCGLNQSLCTAPLTVVDGYGDGFEYETRPLRGGANHGGSFSGTLVNLLTRRRNQFRTVTVSCFPKDGALPSEVMSASREKLNAFAAALPPGYKMEVGGEEEEQVKGFKNLAVVLLISIVAIFLALVFQFKHAIKPLVVFAAIPFGMVGALAALWVMGSPFGFMAFLGCVSLVGVIVSHVIVLFDFIEEAHGRGESLREALLDAGIMRLRPVMITVGATVFALFPLASHGGPLWEPMCYAQIGGLSVATFVTLLLVPVIYAIFVLDLKLVKWDAVGGHTDGAQEVRVDDRPIPPRSQEGMGIAR